MLSISVFNFNVCVHMDVVFFQNCILKSTEYPEWRMNCSYFRGIFAITFYQQIYISMLLSVL